MGRKSDSNGRCCSQRTNKERSPMHDPRLPSYAQPTTSFRQHASRGDAIDSYSKTKFKAGSGKSNTMRLSSTKSCVNLKEAITAGNNLEFVDLFYSRTEPGTPEKRDSEVAFNSIRRKSHNYRPPSLAQRAKVENQLAIEALTKEAGLLMKQVTEDLDEEEFRKVLQFYESKMDGKFSVGIDDWKSLIKHHEISVQKLQDKIKLNFELIHSVLELNNEISQKYSKSQRELESAMKEIENMSLKTKSFDSTGEYFAAYQDVFRVAKPSQELLFPSDENFQDSGFDNLTASSPTYKKNIIDSFKDLRKSRKSFSRAH